MPDSVKFVQVCLFLKFLNLRVYKTLELFLFFNNQNTIHHLLMKKLLLFILFPILVQSQTDTIFCKDATIIVCKITLVNNYNMFYTENKVGKSIEIKKVENYSLGGKRLEAKGAIKPESKVETNNESGKSYRTKVRTPGGFIVKNNQEFALGVRASEDANYKYMMAVRPGFVTTLVMQDSIRNLNKEFCDIELKPLSGLDSKRVKNSLAFAGFIDKTEKVRIIEYLSAYQYTYVKLDAIEFKALIGSNLMNNGFKVINEDEEVFHQKNKIVDYALAGEIVHYEYSSKGTPGFIISVVVRWTLYDVMNNENVCKFLTGGYSNSQKRNSIKEELKLALNDALGGFIDNEEVRKSMYGAIVGTETKSEMKEILLPAVSSKGGGENYIQNSIQSAVTIQSKHGHGSGFLISSDGYILTNYHVIRDSVELQAIFQNEMTLTLEIVAYDSKVDVALCKVPGKGYKPMPLDTGNSVKKIGSDVVTIGTPEDIQFGQTVTKGIISGIREINGNVLIQTDVAINSGNSGGMLINKNGEVLGIVVSKIKKEGTEGMGFAVPVNSAIKALNIKLVKQD